MEKVRPRYGQPSDQGRLKNGTEQISRRHARRTRAMQRLPPIVIRLVCTLQTCTVPHTNRPAGHQRRCTKRLIVSDTAASVGRRGHGRRRLRSEEKQYDYRQQSCTTNRQLTIERRGRTNAPPGHFASPEITIADSCPPTEEPNHNLTPILTLTLYLCPYVIAPGAAKRRRRRQFHSRRIYVRPRTGPQSAHPWWPASSRQPAYL